MFYEDGCGGDAALLGRSFWTCSVIRYLDFSVFYRLWSHDDTSKSEPLISKNSWNWACCRFGRASFGVSFLAMRSRCAVDSDATHFPPAQPSTQPPCKESIAEQELICGEENLCCTSLPQWETFQNGFGEDSQLGTIGCLYMIGATFRIVT